MSDTQVPHEVVIVRRRGGDGDEGHHGGAWKIAFADLMTAMMAFFLVMWLLNVSDREKISQIATYFNPLKLNSKRPTTKGPEDEQDTDRSAPITIGPAEKGADISTVDDSKTHHGASKAGGDGDLEEGVAHKAEEELFNDPYGVLSRLALKASSEDDDKGAEGDSVSSGGDAFSNPFEPFADRTIAQPPKEPPPLTIEQGGSQPTAPGLEKPLVVDPEGVEDVPADANLATTPVQPGEGTDAGADNGNREAEALEAEIAKQLQGLAADKKPSIDVAKVDGGILISLTDDFRFGMFASASAQPNPQLVVVMEKVAQVLAGREGQVVVRGHTDARKFRSERNNNWRLSMDRAQMAYYMLARGGVDEKRFESIEGFADRVPKIPSDTNAAENRRIEIMLKVPRS
jgi:chemotaxis protein MotB